MDWLLQLSIPGRQGWPVAMVAVAVVELLKLLPLVVLGIYSVSTKSILKSFFEVQDFSMILGVDGFATPVHAFQHCQQHHRTTR